MPLKHVLSANQFDRTMLSRLFAKTDEVRALFQTKDREQIRTIHSVLAGASVAIPFYQPSTRTRFSFESAAKRLGADVVFSSVMGLTSSAAKGEAKGDTAYTLANYHHDFIIVRHPEIGTAKAFADIIDRYSKEHHVLDTIHVINGGDGPGEHPTQALLDIYTLLDEIGTLKGKTILFGGDIGTSRAARSVLELLTLFDDVRVILCAPQDLQLSESEQASLTARGLKISLNTSPEEYWGDADGIYWIRLQDEYHKKASHGWHKQIWSYAQDLFKTKNKPVRPYPKEFIIDSKTLEKMKPVARILHPRPRRNEIAMEVDTDPRAAYLREEQNGFYLRIALLWMLDQGSL